MKSINFKLYLWATLVISVLIWSLLLLVYQIKLEFSSAVFKQVPTVITLDLVIWSLFIKYGWKMKIFKGWLVQIPILQGTWRGELQSNWINPDTKQTLPSIPILLVIRQSFLTINCTLYTAESSSYSFVSSFLLDEETGTRRLIYFYTNKPRTLVRHRSEIHDGTAVFDILGTPPANMIGEYWTSRGTSGEMRVEHISTKLAESFQAGVTFPKPHAT
ncbi:hypothetical protein [Cohnella sp. GCM10027633]|uniref:Cap15 family cyclic dinucleotide receptor domain-containing protein n=1 Tax=unclassified Cohnella TaxID=2636738 RepID=UPI00362F5A0F